MKIWYNYIEARREGVYYMIDYREIERKAEDIREKYHLSKNNVKLYEFLETLNIDAFKVPALSYKGEEILGAIKSKNNKVAIIVNSKASTTMQRKIIAHELGHYFLHIDKENEYTEFCGFGEHTEKKELEAEYFSDCLLMNSEFIKEKYKEIRKIGFTKETTIDLLAKLFSVRSIDVARRVKQLNL